VGPARERGGRRGALRLSGRVPAAQVGVNGPDSLRPDMSDRFGQFGISAVAWREMPPGTILMEDPPLP
jgi:hypothetical protein